MTSQEQADQNHPGTETILNRSEATNKIAAEIYDAETTESGWDSPERTQRLVEQYVHEGSVVLDIGIGTGQTVRGYAEKGATVVGIDHDLDMLTVARSVAGELGLMRQADINEPLPIADLVGKVDVAQAIGVLEFAKDLGDVVEQVRQTLVTDGVFVFTIETLANPYDGLRQQYADLTIYRHTAEEVRELLHGNGFGLLHDEAYDGYERGDTATNKVPYHIFLAQKQK
ncbi:MAG: class I SAM-dependent methyltransferase [Candidatus Saccharimonadales bacterium]